MLVEKRDLHQLTACQSCLTSHEYIFLFCPPVSPQPCVAQMNYVHLPAVQPSSRAVRTWLLDSMNPYRPRRKDEGKGMNVFLGEEGVRVATCEGAALEVYEVGRDCGRKREVEVVAGRSSWRERGRFIERIVHIVSDAVSL